MEEVYVKQDIFAEIIKRLEAQNAASEARVSAQIAENNARLEVYRADSRREAESLAFDIKAIKDRLDLMDMAASRRWTIIGVAAAIIGAAIAAIPYLPAIKIALGW